MWRPVLLDPILFDMIKVLHTMKSGTSEHCLYVLASGDQGPIFEHVYCGGGGGCYLFHTSILAEMKHIFQQKYWKIKM
jgi:hypothetical protein